MESEIVATRNSAGHSPVMLTGNQIRTLRAWARIDSQDDLALRVKVSRQTIAKIERSGDAVPGKVMIETMLAIVKVFEQAGVQFYLPQGETPTEGLHIYYPPRPKPLPPLMDGEHE